jgi:diguanylate cyclase (GGDEF)-like protein
VQELLADWEDEKRLQEALTRLKFWPEAEADFRSSDSLESRAARGKLAALAFILLGLSPIYHKLLGVPPDLYQVFERLHFWLMLPAITISWCASQWPALQRWSTAALVGAGGLISAGLMTERILGQSVGFLMPAILPIIPVVAIFLIGRVRFFVFLPCAVINLIAVNSAELWLQNFNSAAAYICFSQWVLMLVIAMASWMLERGVREGFMRRRQLQRHALTDPLTGLSNRRYFDAALKNHLRMAHRNRSSVSLMLLDVDHFKAYNDDYGHPAGDECLRTVGRWLRRSIQRSEDFCARIGGEEFAAVWFGADEPNALRLAESMRAGIRSLNITHRHTLSGFVTASAGFARWTSPNNSTVIDFEAAARALLQQADSALYTAKKQGRARLHAHNDLAAPPLPETQVGTH